jgi:hypothetical protein
MVSEITIKISMAGEDGSSRVGEVRPGTAVVVEEEIPFNKNKQTGYLISHI